MHNFLQRSLTALILIPLAVICIFYLPPIAFNVLMAVIVGYGAWEWGRLSATDMCRLPIVFVIVVLLGFGLVFIIPVIGILVVSFCWWLIALWLISQYPKCRRWSSYQLVKLIMGFLVLVPCWAGFYALRMQPHGPHFVILAVIFVWAADTGAYFVGKFCGKHKLAPSVSPGKTIEGLLGGVVLTAIVALISLLMLRLDWPMLIYLVTLAIVAGLFSIIGDLMESMLKREAGAKDSGSLFPGHGGMLDRLDGMTAGIPVFSLGLLLLNFH